MSKVGNDIIAGMENAIRYLNGEEKGIRRHRIKVPKSVNVKVIRQRLKLTQKAFASEYGFTLSAVREWEQGRRRPERSARILLKIIEHDPEIVNRILSA